MRDILEQINKGLHSNLYYLSLFVTLSLPDICGAISSTNGQATSEKFEKWFDKYIAPKYGGFLTGSDCYKFRCSLLHQGTTKHPKSNYTRILFLEPKTTNIVMHNNVLNDALNIDISIFCTDMIKGVEEWLAEVEEKEIYKINFDKFIKRYPNGLSPYITGIAVIG